jgi:hypothetical protein
MECKICKSEYRNVLEEFYFYRKLSFRELIKFFRGYGLVVNLYNLSNHLNNHVSQDTIDWYIEQRRLRDVEENFSIAENASC